MREFSSGIIVFRRSPTERLYLLLHYRYRGDYWDFPRGNIKNGETTKQAAVRETGEETGLREVDVEFMEAFEESASWHYRLRGKTVFKRVTYFLAETEREDIKISSEHVGYRWLRFVDALRLLRYKNSKKLLLKAEEFLQRLEEQDTVKAR